MKERNKKVRNGELFLKIGLKIVDKGEWVC